MERNDQVSLPGQPSNGDAKELQLSYLSRVCAGAQSRGLEAVLRGVLGDRPMLHVRNPASGLREVVECRFCPEDAISPWWLFWSWGAPMVPADQADVAAQRLVYVLAGAE